ncbi:ribosome biogenesis protein NOP53-like [Physella acuta]|uniref:ribosome biogenesis protein NOP53-like n=1 Tax=Physella acuta TaxID=109671 RepID=UPI0027DB3C66|nr:ribosome biogenesis protein NOP53-like [Physella acuta]
MAHNMHNAPKLSKKRKLGKNKKKSWRAVNVDDIEEYLEDERRQIRTGGLVSEKADDTLFVLDKSTQKDSTAKSLSKRSLREKPLKCLALLQPDPHSKLVRKPDQVTFKKGKRSERILNRLRERSTSLVRLNAESQRQKYIVEKLIKREHKKQLPVVDEVLWSDDTDDLKAPKPKKRKISALPATPVPHPGTSVNPAYDEHQDLLLQAHIKELNRIKKEKKIFNSLDAKFPSQRDAPDQNTYLLEMSAGLVDESDDEDEEAENDNIPKNPPVRREDRKTKRQKRIEKEEKEKMKLKAKEDELKQKERMVLRIPTIKSEINKAERLRKEKEAIKLKEKELEKFKTKRLGKIRYEDADLDLKLSEELVASLREVKPEGHILHDVYKSLQRRNIIEPRMRQKRMKKKFKPKKVEKKGHKAVKL